MERQTDSYRQLLREKGLKSTRQRDLIVQEFFRKHQHLTVDELVGKVRGQDPSIGPATVYRTLNLLTELGLALKREFGGGRARFEHVTARHHDHLICVKCGHIIEFENAEIERLQDRVCSQHHFKLVNHRMELYGYCQKCRGSGEKRAGR